MGQGSARAFAYVEHAPERASCASSSRHAGALARAQLEIPNSDWQPDEGAQPPWQPDYSQPHAGQTAAPSSAPSVRDGGRQAQQQIMPLEPIPSPLPTPGASFADARGRQEAMQLAEMQHRHQQAGLA